eukprot:TRINITY_DN575_c0_g2_i1.p1 TRINITY_DN575_c0_g2~~TRINITY_DN575_c0_g2_i1.p1  ORF type:complete len:482 (+),score=139.01 TRINITY_DN575_c0_g2_i1:150-1595(+)
MSLEASIQSLISRLETVTSRLEDVEKKVAAGASHSSLPASSSNTPASSGSGGSDHPSVRAYDDLVSQYVHQYVELSAKIAPEVKQQAELFQKAIESQRKMIILATQAKKPSDADLQAIIKPTSDLMQEITSLRDKQRTSKFFNNLSTVSEGVGALGWVVVSPTPGPHVGDMRGGSEFYSNRILKDFKDKDQTQVDWVKAYNGFLKELQTYIKNFHTTGLTWNANGGDAKTLAQSGASSAPAKAPTPAPSATTTTSTSAPKPDITNVFSAISKGTDVTSSLKKVTDDMKTKNRKPEERSSVVTADSSKKPAVEKSEGPAKAVSKPPKLALEGNKWVVEYQKNNREIKIAETETRQTVYIYKCEGSTIQIVGKINTIIVDDCKKTAVVFENVISGIEIVNSTALEVQVIGKVPSIAVDKTSGLQLFLSKETLDSEIITSKSSDVNVLIPGKKEGDDPIELPLPYQFKTLIKNDTLVTNTVEHV